MERNQNGGRFGPRKRPCSTCPYRRDIPSGIWSADEYAKLPHYDGDVPEQAAAGAFGIFMCHQLNGAICSGWAGCHDMQNNLALRMAGSDVDPAILDYVSPIPLFASGAEAAEHGLRDIEHPGREAKAKVAHLMRVRARRTDR